MTSISSLVDELVISIHRAVSERHGALLRPIIQGWKAPMPGVAIDLAEFELTGSLTVEVARMRFPFVPVDELVDALAALPRGAALDGDLARILDARAETAAAAWSDVGLVERAVPGADAALGAASRPLAIAHRALPSPDATPWQLHHLLTGLRYKRLGAHVAVCDANGLARRDAVALTAAWSGDDLDGWPTALVDRGLLDDSGVITLAGRELRDRIETETEAACEPMWSALDDPDAWTATLAALADARGHSASSPSI